MLVTMLCVKKGKKKSGQKVSWLKLCDFTRMEYEENGRHAYTLVDG